MAVSVLCRFLMVPWVGMQCVTVAFQGHTRIFIVLASKINFSPCIVFSYSGPSGILGSDGKQNTA